MNINIFLLTQTHENLMEETEYRLCVARRSAFFTRKNVKSVKRDIKKLEKLLAA